MNEDEELLSKLETLCARENLSIEDKEIINLAIEKIQISKPKKQNKTKLAHRPPLTINEINTAILLYFFNDKNISKASKDMGISRSGFRNRLKKLGDDWKSILGNNFNELHEIPSTFKDATIETKRVFEIIDLILDNVNSKSFDEYFKEELAKYFIYEKKESLKQKFIDLLFELRKTVTKYNNSTLYMKDIMIIINQDLFMNRLESFLVFLKSNNIYSETLTQQN